MKMKTITVLLLLTLVLSACSRPGAAASASNTNTPLSPQSSQPTGTMGKLTEEEAKTVALRHAGFTADQVSGLRISFEIDDGIPQYDIEFREGLTEYEYEIHASTGQIISFEKDN